MALNATLTTRVFNALIAAGLPVIGVGAVNSDAKTCRVDWASTPTGAQTTLAASTLAALDWSSAADDAYVLQQERASALSTFLSDPSASAKVLRAVALVLLDQVNTLEAQIQTLRNDCRVAAPSIPVVTYPQYTTTDLQNAVQTKINAGIAD